MRVEGKWLGNSFDDFLQRIPKEELYRQLYMFSARCDINEAVDGTAGLSHHIITENFDRDIDALNRKTGLTLKAIHTRKTPYKASIPESSIANLREMLEKEYVFLDRIKDIG